MKNKNLEFEAWFAAMHSIHTNQGWKCLGNSCVFKTWKWWAQDAFEAGQKASLKNAKEIRASEIAFHKEQIRILNASSINAGVSSEAI